MSYNYSPDKDYLLVDDLLRLGNELDSGTIIVSRTDNEETTQVENIQPIDEYEDAIKRAENRFEFDYILEEGWEPGTLAGEGVLTQDISIERVRELARINTAHVNK